MRRGTATALAIALVVLAGPWLVNLLLNRPAATDTSPNEAPTSTTAPDEPEDGGTLEPEVGSLDAGSPRSTGFWVKVRNPADAAIGPILIEFLAPSGTELLSAQPSEASPDLSAECGPADEPGEFRCTVDSIAAAGEGVLDVFLHLPGDKASPVTIRASIEGKAESTGSVEFTASRATQ